MSPKRRSAVPQRFAAHPVKTSKRKEPEPLDMSSAWGDAELARKLQEEEDAKLQSTMSTMTRSMMPAPALPDDFVDAMFDMEPMRDPKDFKARLTHVNFFNSALVGWLVGWLLLLLVVVLRCTPGSINLGV